MVKYFGRDAREHDRTRNYTNFVRIDLTLQTHASVPQ